jgi:DnaJ-class molecular chaperone
MTAGDETPDEPITRPDVHRVTCPECRGRKTVTVVEETGTQYRSTRAPCTFCVGEGTVDRQRFTDWHAKRSGRPRPGGERP